MQTKTPYDDGALKRGDLCFKPGKDACMSSNLKHCTYIFDLLQENPQRNPTRLWTKKESLS